MNARILQTLCVGSLSLLAACAAPSGSSSSSTPMNDENAVVHAATAADMAQAKDPAPLAATSVTLFVNGMGCPLCVTNVDKQLERVKGVETVKVDLGAGTVDVGLGGKTKPSGAALAEAVDNAGLTLVKIRTNN
ncbi:MAG: heavy-metal-associated domain-containing protein [Phycisphaerales bacterium]